MVSSALDMELSELLRGLAKVREKYATSGDPDYKKLRAALPKEWPV